jgi:hypothetical protein
LLVVHSRWALGGRGGVMDDDCRLVGVIWKTCRPTIGIELWTLNCQVFGRMSSICSCTLLRLKTLSSMV